MGFFDFLKGKTETKKEEAEKVTIFAPMDGKVISITEVPDETFASKMLGDGVGIDPAGDVVTLVAPVDGVLTQFFETGHAFTVETSEGVNVLVHCGLNTVELKGEGFEKIAKEGDKVKKGDPIVKADINFLRGKVPSVITPVVILDSDEYKNIETFLGKDVTAGNETVIVVEK